MSTPVLSDKDVIDLVRKEFERQLRSYCSNVGIDMNSEPDQKEENDDENGEDKQTKPEVNKKPKKLDIETINAGLRIQHKDSGLEYYIQYVDNDGEIITLESSDGNQFQISWEELEKDYELS